MTIDLMIAGSDLGGIREGAAALGRREVRMVAARGVRNRAQAHYQDLQDRRPNKMGWPRQNFWSQVRRSVQAPRAQGAVVIIGINHVGIAQRIFGGVIKPRTATFLTIPARAEAYGKRAREFDNLEFDLVETDRGFAPALVESERTELRRVRIGGRRRRLAASSVLGATGGGVMFWLVRQVEQEPDPTALPAEEDLMKAAVDPAVDWIRRNVPNRN